VPFTQVDLSALPEIEQKSAIEAAAAKLQASLNLTEGPLLRVAFFNLGQQKTSRLLILIHHLAVDGVSWRILLEDFQTAYEQVSRGEAIHLQPKTTSFKQWAERLQEYAQSAELQQEQDYWLAERRKPVARLPVDYSGGENTVAAANTLSVSLNQKETQALLQQVPKAYNTQINDVLLTALVQAFAEWTGERTLLVEQEGHGREDVFDDVDLSRTIGWFTTIFPVVLKLEEASHPSDALKAVKDQLRNIPNRGLGYGVLRYLSKDVEPLQFLIPQAEVLFNYLGQSDQVFQSSLFAPAQESSGSTHSPRQSRRYLLDVNAIVAGGCLQVSLTYSKAIHRPATIESLAEAFMQVLRSLIMHCQSLSTGGYTPSTELVAALNADAVLDSTIRPNNVPVHKTEPACIFLTGATGFVGAFLLYELLQQTTADIYCLVRAPNAESGKKRLQSKLESYLLWDESLSPRIIPVVGDMSQPLLGLDNEQFRAIAKKLDVIYHNAAFINLVYPYSVVKAANVLGTQEILRLASQIKVKPVHFMSTLSVFDSVDCSEGKKILEVDNLEHVGVPDIGYVQSKWVAEKLVTTARERGIPVSIYRLGRMSGHSKTGVSNTDDFMHRVLRGCIQLKSAPDANMMVDMTPVDYVSRAIIHLSKQKESLGKAFHVLNPHPIHWRELVTWLRSFGYPIRQISDQEWQSGLMEQWQAELLNVNGFSSENALHSLVLLFSESVSEPSNSAMRQFDCQNTLDGLADTSIICPPVDEQLLGTYFSYLIQTSFLAPPQPNQNDHY
jgi:thioester reductase-like protein/non-ribosomal peptide synthase protein (TIGR01720 family)